VLRFAALSDLAVPKSEPARQTLERLLRHFEAQQQRSGRRTLLIIDDADRLPKEEMRLYPAVFRELPPETGTVLLLSGTPELIEAVSVGSEGVREDWFHQIQVKPLNEDEMQAYLQSWLETCGLSQPLRLSESQLSHLAEMGKGLPGRINRVFPGVFLGAVTMPDAESRKPSMIPTRVVLATIASLLALSYVIVAGQHGWWQSDPESPVQRTLERPDTEAGPTEEQVTARLRRIDEAMQRLARTAQTDAEVASPPAEMSEESAPVSAQDYASIAFVGEQIVPAQRVEPAAQSSLVAQDAPSARIPVLEALVQPHATAESGAAGAEPETPVIGTYPPSEQVAATEETAEQTGPRRSASWVRAQSKSAFAAQVLGTYTEQTAREFVTSMPTAVDDIYYVETRYKSKPWFVVLYGVFPDRAAAARALQSAPVRVQNQKPWLRSFDGIRASLP
jgi:septal ring-binding cell division protein DamX